jgi:hypothetical protein
MPLGEKFFKMPQIRLFHKQAKPFGKIVFPCWLIQKVIKDPEEDGSGINKV